MPRKPRMYLPGVPCHAIQRDNNRAACFFYEQDYRFYLECLGLACRQYHVELHAYVLMTNQFLCGTPHNAGLSIKHQAWHRQLHRAHT